MYKLIEFIRSIYVVLLFVVIEAVALNYYAQSSYYTQARLLAHVHRMAGGVQGGVAGVKHFFMFGRENRMLLDRVGELETELARYRSAENAARLDAYMATVGESQYELSTATVVSNSVNKQNNFLVINKGRRDGVVPDMAVLSPDGAMIAYVVEVSERYAVALSVLSTAFRASGQLAGSDYFGSISWDGTDSRFVTMAELSKYATPKEGDEVVSTGFSQYFPADILIGTVEDFTLNEGRTAYTLRIRLTVDLTGLGDVILVHNRDMEEIDGLHTCDKVMDITTP